MLIALQSWLLSNGLDRALFWSGIASPHFANAGRKRGPPHRGEIVQALNLHSKTILQRRRGRLRSMLFRKTQRGTCHTSIVSARPSSDQCHPR